MRPPWAEVEPSLAPSSVSKSTVTPKGVALLVEAAVALADGAGLVVADLHQRAQRVLHGPGLGHELGLVLEQRGKYRP